MFEYSLAVSRLVASIHVVYLSPVTESTKALSEERDTWDAVSTRLIEEVKLLSSPSSAAARPNYVRSELNICAICTKVIHSLVNCFLNPFVNNSKLKLPAGAVSEILHTPGNGNGNKGKGGNPAKVGGHPTNQKRASMSHGRSAQYGRKAVIIMPYSGTTSHLTPFSDLVESTTSSDLSFTLADNSKMRSTHSGVRKVRIQNEDGLGSVSL